MWPPFGNEELRNGDGPDLWFPFLMAVNNSSAELVGSGGGGVSRLNLCTELLLLRCWTSVLSSGLVREKKVPFDAVMGVVGVFAICLAGGGERFLSDRPCSWRAAILAAVGVLSGPRVMGGSLNGCNVFFDCGATGFVPMSTLEGLADLRWLGLRCILTGGGSFSTPVTLPVELLWMLLASNARVDLLLSKNPASASVSLGDSYALGIAGTGGTSPVSSRLAELWRVKAFGAGSRELASWELRC